MSRSDPFWGIDRTVTELEPSPSRPMEMDDLEQMKNRILSQYGRPRQFLLSPEECRMASMTSWSYCRDCRRAHHTQARHLTMAERSAAASFPCYWVDGQLGREPYLSFDIPDEQLGAALVAAEAEWARQLVRDRDGADHD